MSPENQPYILSHAQNREDVILSGFFKNIENGFYIDIGANDPSEDSVTKLFYEKGWSGINVEPIPRLYKKLHAARPRDTNLNIGISDKADTMTFREYSDMHGLSTFSKDVQSEYDKLSKKDAKYADFKEYTVPVKTLAQLFEEQKVGTINFMKIDVEGYEYEVIKGNDWKRYRPQVVCIESNHIKKDWRPTLEKQGYKSVFFDGLNTYYVSDTAKIDFSYIETMLPTAIVDYRVARVIEYYKNSRLEAEARNTELSTELHIAQHNLFTLQQDLDKARSVKTAVKTIAIRANNIVEEIIIPSRYRGVTVNAPTKTVSLKVVDSMSSKEIFDAVKKYDNTVLVSLDPPAHRIRFWMLFTYRRYVLGGIKRVARLVLKNLKRG